MTKRGGRPPEDDWPLLLHMALLLVQGLAKSFRGAARQVAAKAKGASPAAIEDRLRHKYAKDRAELEAQARELIAARDRRPPARARIARSSPDDIARPSGDSAAKSLPPSAAKKTRD